MPENDPSPAAELAAVLRRLRSDAGVTGADLGTRIGSSQATVSRYESGRLVPTMLTAGRIGWALRAPALTRRHLVELARAAADERSGIVPKRVLLQQGVAQLQRRIRHRERSASHVATFHPTLVPGLLQTEGYMRALIATRSGLPDPEREAWVRERQGRQLHMVQPGRSGVQIVAETALHWGAAGSDVMIEQCEHLAWLATGRPEWHVGVIPRRLPPGTPPLFVSNGFNIHDSATVLLGTTAGNAVITEPRVVQDHLDLFARIEELAVFGREAAAVFEAVADLYLSDQQPTTG
jgi:transcriptional regulator with XRE-family HTH domain